MVRVVTKGKAEYQTALTKLDLKFVLMFLLNSSAEKPAQESSSSGSSGGWGWGGWTSVLSQATASVTSGLSSVIETVETTLGVPDPEEMARKVKAEEKLVKEKAAEAKDTEHSGESKGDSTTEGQ